MKSMIVTTHRNAWQAAYWRQHRLNSSAWKRALCNLPAAEIVRQWRNTAPHA